MEREQQFADDNNPVHKNNRRQLLNVLIELAPKSDKRSKVTPVDVVRSTMQNLANDEIWQYVCAMGKSGSKKVAMATSMSKIYRAVCLTASKVLNITLQDAKTALSTYLKNTSNRAASKHHKLNSLKEILSARGEAIGNVHDIRDRELISSSEDEIMNRRRLSSSSGQNSNSLSRVRRVSSSSDSN